MSLHPVVRIITFLILVTTLARLGLPELLLFAGLFLVFAARMLATRLIVLWRFVRRLKWFWLSILLLYTLMPGNGATGDIIHYDGLLTGLLRCLSLLVILMYFVLLVAPIPSPELLRSWYWLMRPLRYVGLSPERISLRIGLTFAAVERIQAQPREAQQPISLRNLPEHLYQFMRMAITQAGTASDSALTQPSCLTSPPWQHWLIPLGVTLLLMGHQLVF